MREIGGGTPFFYYMTKHADGHGRKNHNRDHSTNRATIRITPIDRMVYIITSVVVCVKATTEMAPDQYGNMPALNRGVKLNILRDGEVVVDTTAGVPVRTNADWMHIGQDFDYIPGLKKTDPSYWISRWQYAIVGEPAILDGVHKDEFVALLRDDFSPLLEHHFLVFGYKRSK